MRKKNAQSNAQRQRHQHDEPDGKDDGQRGKTFPDKQQNAVTRWFGRNRPDGIQGILHLPEHGRSPDQHSQNAHNRGYQASLLEARTADRLLHGLGSLSANRILQLQGDLSLRRLLTIEYTNDTHDQNNHRCYRKQREKSQRTGIGEGVAIQPDLGSVLEYVQPVFQVVD